MFVKNYYRLLSYDNTHNGQISENCYFTGTAGEKRYLKLANGNGMDAVNFRHNNDYTTPYIGRVASSQLTSHKIYSSSTGMSGVFFGDGDTPVTLDDYFLSGNIISGLSWSNTINIEFDENGYTLTSLFTLSNPGSESVTIKEIALIGAQSQTYDSITASSTNSYYFRVMIERTVLDAPVTIPAGGVGQVTYTIRVNYPTA